MLLQFLKNCHHQNSNKSAKQLQNFKFFTFSIPFYTKREEIRLPFDKCSKEASVHGRIFFYMLFQINGKRGFVNRRHLREMRVLVKDPMFLPGQEAPPPQEPVATPPKLPDATTEAPSAAKAEEKPVEATPPIEVPKPEPSPDPVPAVPEKAPEPSKAVQPPESQEPVDQQETQASSEGMH